MSFHDYYIKKINELSDRLEGEKMPKIKAKNYIDLIIFLIAAIGALVGITVFCIILW